LDGAVSKTANISHCFRSKSIKFYRITANTVKLCQENNKNVTKIFVIVKSRY